MSRTEIELTSAQEILLRLKKGDRQSFETLYDSYSPVLLGAICKIQPDEQQAEYILKKVFLKTWKSRESLNLQGGSLLLCLLKLAKKMAADAITPPKNRELNILVCKPGSGQNGNLALDLIYFHGYTYLEAAKTLDLTVAELRTEIKETIQQLKGVPVE